MPRRTNQEQNLAPEQALWKTPSGAMQGFDAPLARAPRPRQYFRDAKRRAIALRLPPAGHPFAMPVYRLFKNKAFEPDIIATMTAAYAEACQALGVSDRDRPQADAVAKKIIEFAQRGERDPARLREHVLQAMRS